MNQAEKDLLISLRSRIDAGEEFNPTLLARYQGLEARDARESGKIYRSLFLRFVLTSSLREIIHHFILTFRITSVPLPYFYRLDFLRRIRYTLLLSCGVCCCSGW